MTFEETPSARELITDSISYDDTQRTQDKSEFVLDYSRDDLFNNFALSTFKESYLLDTESSPQELYWRVASHYGSNKAHSERIYSYMSKHWFSPATPILANGGTNRGLPISCYITEMEDSMHSIAYKWNEHVYIGANGGGLGTGYSKLRSVGEKVGRVGKTSGIIPFIKVQEAQTVAINQGSLRRSNSAIYLHISHPEIEEFLEIRKIAGGDPIRKAHHIHHAVVIDDKFMQAIEDNTDYELVSPKDGSVIRKINARTMWIRIMNLRMETGEPYLLFEDTINRALPEHHKELGLKVTTSNLCSEIVLPTGTDYNNRVRTAVCCLSSLNLEYFDDWKSDPIFIKDVMEFIGNVLFDFAEKAPSFLKDAIYSATQERSIGMGVMGFHYYLQSRKVPFGSGMAKAINRHIFKHIEAKATEANKELVSVFGRNPDGVAAFGPNDEKSNFAFSYKMAIAPTASISILCGNTSPSVEPMVANVYTQKTIAGFFRVVNKHLVALLEKYGRNDEDTLRDILQHDGSVQHLDFLTDDEKDIFKTAKEIDQRWIIELAGDRAPYIDQAQSINLFFDPKASKSYVSKIHLMAFKKGLKSLYYCRSQSVAKSENSTKDKPAAEPQNFDTSECLACQ